MCGLVVWKGGVYNSLWLFMVVGFCGHTNRCVFFVLLCCSPFASLRACLCGCLVLLFCLSPWLRWPPLSFLWLCLLGYVFGVFM